MPTTEQLRSRLIKKLKELFQLDQPDLDFGFYRIMHAKSEQVTSFLEKDLFKIIEEAFGNVDGNKKAELQAVYGKAVEQAKSFGVPNPEETEPVRNAKAALDTVKDSVGAEGEVYNHLYRFFERYYEDGDFISRRYYTRETTDKAAPYAIPYNGEEVKLHWANADQYYIKTAEYFTNFTFDLIQTREVNDWADPLTKQSLPTSLKVHFCINDAAEGEHGNVKASEATKRYFIICKDNPVSLNEGGELVIRFEYRPDPEKTGQEGPWRDNRNAEAVDAILAVLQEVDGADEYTRLLKVPAPTEKNKERPLIAKYINQYTAQNTCDYFIHKNLGGFLRRELDFYIKNEVMRLDDIENADAPVVESYLAKIKVMRKIALKLIDFLAQLEDFQKKLWLKKKFVVETNYCITLDRVPEELYPEIVTNDDQCEEWVKLFAINEIKGDLITLKYSKLLTVEFLKANNKLILDTRFFDEEFKVRLFSSIGNIDDQCDGLLIHSENFQALNLIRERFRGQVECVYIDPPYNTSENAFLYKNSYKHSSWLTMLSNGISITPSFMPRSGLLMGAIDDTEYSNFKTLLSNTFGEGNYVGTIAAEVNPAGQNIRPNVPARSHDYFHIFANDIESIRMILRGLTHEERKQYKEKDSKGHYYWDNLRRRGGNSRPSDRPKQWFPLFIKEEKVRVPEMVWDDSLKKWIIKEPVQNDEKEIWPIDPKGENRIWRVNPDGARREILEDEISVIEKAGRQEVSKKSREPEGKKPKTLWSESKYSATSHGSKLLLDIFGSGLHFSYPKSIHLTTDAIRYWAHDSAYILDFFAGSGTTGHATINLNREDDGKRKYILIEMGSYFNSVLKPRMQKVAYSESWKNGKPITHDRGLSHCFKYFQLESYEDTLNNLQFDDNPAREKALKKNASLREDYMLRYLLDVETRGSQSLLNIDTFSDPTAHTIKVKKPGGDEYVEKNVDLIETFNYLIGLRVIHIAAPQSFVANFKREVDPELPEDQKTRLVVDGRLKQDKDGSWWFRKVEGWLPADSNNPNNGQREKVLIVWRKLTGDLEKDNLMLDEWFQKNRISTRDFEFDTIYVNGSNNLPNLKIEGDNWKVRLIEEDFMKFMWDTENI